MKLFEPGHHGELTDLYRPTMAEIKEVRRLTAAEIYYRLELAGGADLGHTPGQFVELSIFGVGEAEPVAVGLHEIAVRLGRRVPAQ